MSYFKHHVFFCCNQRAEGKSCNALGASAAQTYAKDRIGQLKLKPPLYFVQLRIN